MELKALLKECCWLPYLKYCQLCIQDLGHVLYAAAMLPKFYKITSLEKKIFYTSFQKAIWLRFIGFSSR